jgi:chemotaxis protein MotB
MHGTGWKAGAVAVCAVAAVNTGCVSLDRYKRLEAANRLVIADKEKLEVDLYDERNVAGSLRTRVNSLESELRVKDELISNYRRESELSQGIIDAAKQGIARMADTNLTAPVIMGAKLPPQLDSAIKKFADAHPSEVAYDPASGSVKWKADLLFPLGSDVVNQSALDGLRGFSDILKSPAASDFEVVVVGHTDNRPIVRPETKAAHPTNWHLSAHRAIAVGNILQKNGVAANRVGVMGCSEYRPIAENSSESGNGLNRRVEIYLVPVGSIVHAGTPIAANQPPKQAALDFGAP